MASKVAGLLHDHQLSSSLAEFNTPPPPPHTQGSETERGQEQVDIEMGLKDCGAFGVEGEAT